MLKSILWKIYQNVFRLCERLGIHITPVHFYMPIPDTSKLNDELWEKHSELVGIKMNEERQLELLSVFSKNFKEEYEKFPKEETDVPYRFYLNNRKFESVDAEVLYSMIRYFKPEKIIEIGAGYSTFLSAQAILKNEEEDANYRCELVSIDPYPNEILKRGFPGFAGLIEKNVQDVPWDVFKQLKKNDILFIDSSHVLKIGSDVQYIYLEILPRLNEGVLIHIHDIFFPAEYPKKWVIEGLRFWNEQYLVQAFLSFNNRFEILWAGSYMHLKHSDKLESSFPSYNKETVWPGSLWIRRVN